MKSEKLKSNSAEDLSVKYDELFTKENIDTNIKNTEGTSLKQPSPLKYVRNHTTYGTPLVKLAKVWASMSLLFPGYGLAFIYGA